MNDNGEKLTDLRAINNLVICGTLFPPQEDPQGDLNITRLLHREPDRPRVYLKEVSKTFQNVKANRGADVASDHHLVLARLKLKLKKKLEWRDQVMPEDQHHHAKGYISKQEEYSLSLTNRFQVLQELLGQETIDEQWKKVKEAETTTCKEVFDLKKHSHKEWITQGTLE
jgi:hypothetical protein